MFAIGMVWFHTDLNYVKEQSMIEKQKKKMWNSPVAGSATKGLAEEPSRCTRLPSSCRAQTSTCWLAATSEAWDFPSLFSITASPERQKFR